ncbi:PREDICTED: uncharacterized protein LOC101630709 [Condylura cristata]|uniref:uncharacterized protein LOC101630709 n=1 Tax=Condylura cristata TaxID=143302 RepID=UPI000642A5A6|nr:PREDICTED: uncharacterized protein LOC101630709 [Condylura cristata]
MKKLLGQSLFILWLQLASVSSQQIEQTLQTLSVQEGENATMTCSYKVSITNLQWYKQDLGRSLTRLILIRANEKKKDNGRFQVTLDASTQNSSMLITASEVADSAVYFCAVDAQCSPSTCSPDTNCQSCLLHAPPRAGVVVMPSHEGESSTPGSRIGTSSQVCDFVEAHFVGLPFKEVTNEGPTPGPGWGGLDWMMDLPVMLSASCAALIILLMLRRTSGDSVIQTAGPVILLEGGPLTLSCTFQSSYPATFFFWYVQRPNIGLEFLLRSSSENTKLDSSGFQASHTNKTSTLQKTWVQVSDSAVYFCAAEAQ